MFLWHSCEDGRVAAHSWHMRLKSLFEQPNQCSQLIFQFFFAIQIWQILLDIFCNVRVGNLAKYTLRPDRVAEASRFSSWVCWKQKHFGAGGRRNPPRMQILTILVCLVQMKPKAPQKIHYLCQLWCRPVVSPRQFPVKSVPPTEKDSASDGIVMYCTWVPTQHFGDTPTLSFHLAFKKSLRAHLGLVQNES